MQLATGARFHGRYEVVRCIKTGGMGAVYEVIHAETRRRAALKVMLPSVVANPDMRARFKLEMTVAADVESEHIVEIYDAGVDEDGTPFIVMELLRGQELSQVFLDRGRLPPEEVVLLLWQAALALDKTHAAGIVHRDLKPDNLFITTRDEGTPRLKILDFGIAKVVSRDAVAAKATLAVGTPIYMSPEHIRGDPAIGPPTDIYALGQIAYELLVGEAYWDELVERAEALYSALIEIAAGAKEAPRARAARRRGVELPEAFDAWFAKATAPAFQDRFQRASELVAELANVFHVPLPRPAAAPLSSSGLLPRPSSASANPERRPHGLVAPVSVDHVAFDEPSGSSGVPSRTGPVPPGRSRRPALWAAGAGIAVGIILAIVLIARSGGSKDPDISAGNEPSSAASPTPPAMAPAGGGVSVEPAGGAPAKTADPAADPAGSNSASNTISNSGPAAPPTNTAKNTDTNTSPKPTTPGTGAKPASPKPTSPPPVKDPLDDR
ncbi:MAG: protein kinase [Polyangiaceae bacterium]|nr:protein kinase [Polyangiaceae bacterium]